MVLVKRGGLQKGGRKHDYLKQISYAKAIKRGVPTYEREGKRITYATCGRQRAFTEIYQGWEKRLVWEREEKDRGGSKPFVGLSIIHE